MSVYRVYAKSYVVENLPWSLTDDGWIAKFKTISAAERFCETTPGRKLVIMRESKEHLDYMKEL